MIFIPEFHFTKQRYHRDTDQIIFTGKSKAVPVPHHEHKKLIVCDYSSNFQKTFLCRNIPTGYILLQILSFYENEKSLQQQFHLKFLIFLCYGHFISVSVLNVKGEKNKILSLQKNKTELIMILYGHYPICDVKFNLSSRIFIFITPFNAAFSSSFLLSLRSNNGEFNFVQQME